MGLGMVVIGVAGLIVNTCWGMDASSWLGIRAGIEVIFAVVFGFGLGIITGQQSCIRTVNILTKRALENPRIFVAKR